MPDFVESDIHIKPLVLCNGIANASAHRISTGSYLEVDCVAVDVCNERNDRDEIVSRAAWHHRTVSALRLRSELTAMDEEDESALAARNQNSIEYLRVPRGVVVKLCAPDFAVLRETGEHICNEDTIETVLGDCHGADLPSTCQYTPTQGADCVQMVRYELAPDWGCHEQTDVPTGYRLSSISMPNYFADCSSMVGARFTSRCEFECLPEYIKVDGVCELKCSGFALQCEDHQYASEVCEVQAVPRYKCSECQARPGFSVTSFAARTDRTHAECEQTECEAGSYGSGGTCRPCEPDTYSNSNGATRCEHCPWGEHQPASGATVCVACFGPGSLNVLGNPECEAGTQAFNTLTDIEGYFASVNGTREFTDSALGVAVLRGFCRAGHACLPCPPGSREEAGTCFGCPHGTYQPHFKASACFACASGQTTVETHSTRSTDCVCVPGFE
jgi:hypothetical protein